MNASTNKNNSYCKTFYYSYAAIDQQSAYYIYQKIRLLSLTRYISENQQWKV